MLQTPKKVLIFAAHQDDETIGCGGTIKKWSDLGTEVTVVFFTNGDTGIDQKAEYTPDSIVATRMEEANKAKEILGIHNVYTFDIPCQCVENNQETFHKTIAAIRMEKPEIILTHAPHDKHRDHRIISEIVKEACRKAYEDIHPELGPTHRIKDLWAFEISDLLPRVDFVVDVSSSAMKAKLKAFNAYHSQLGVIHGLVRHIRGSSVVRGYMIGANHGEAYMRINTSPMSL